MNKYITCTNTNCPRDACSRETQVLDHSITGRPPSYGYSTISRQQVMCSSPREPSSWKLTNSPTNDSAVKLPRSIDWDMIAEEETDPVMLAGAGAGPSREHIRLALTTPNLGLADALGKKIDNRPSAAFMNTGRDSALSERSTQAPESGRYEPKLTATHRRAPAVTILDRSLLRTKTTYDEKDFIIPDKPRLHQAETKISKTSGRDKPVVGRIICTVKQAEQSACFGWKSQAQEAIIYDTDVYYEKGGGSRKVPIVPDFSKTPGRDKAMSPKKEMLWSQPRNYSRRWFYSMYTCEVTYLYLRHDASIHMKCRIYSLLSVSLFLSLSLSLSCSLSLSLMLSLSLSLPLSLSRKRFVHYSYFEFPKYFRPL